MPSRNARDEHQRIVRGCSRSGSAGSQNNGERVDEKVLQVHVQANESGVMSTTSFEEAGELYKRSLCVGRTVS